MGRRPSLQFYPYDWRSDPDLQRCSLAARGLWIELMSIMHESKRYGYLVREDGPLDVYDIAALVRSDAEEVSKLLDELREKHVPGFVVENGEEILISKRMVRDEKKRKSDALRKKRERATNGNDGDYESVRSMSTGQGTPRPKMSHRSSSSTSSVSSVSYGQKRTKGEGVASLRGGEEKGQDPDLPPELQIWWDHTHQELQWTEEFVRTKLEMNPAIPEEYLRTRLEYFSAWLRSDKGRHKLDHFVATDGLEMWLDARLREDFANYIVRGMGASKIPLRGSPKDVTAPPPGYAERMRREDEENIAKCKRDHSVERKKGRMYWTCVDGCGWKERLPQDEAKP